MEPFGSFGVFARGHVRIIVTSAEGEVLADQRFRVSGMTLERVDTPED